MRPKTGAEWFDACTFDAEPVGVGDVLARKKESGLTIGVCLPTLDEQQTIGDICRAITGHLGARSGLVDELVVVDSGSRDATMKEAADAGAVVYAMDEILPQWNDPRAHGKGEALWKSLAVTSSDVIVWLDADVRNFDPNYVVQLAARILLDHFALVKAYYRRPLREPTGEEGAATIDPWGGGRVTELLARPLLNTLLPQLSYLVQPLAGECAARRELLLDIPIATGYGVEIGVLVDAVMTRGLDALAQVNLGTRLHRNRDSRALGRMGYEVLGALLRRLDRYGLIKIVDELPAAMVQFSASDTGAVAQMHSLTTIDRPAMRTVLSG